MIDLEKIMDVHFIGNDYTLLEIMYEDEANQKVTMTIDITDEENPDVKEILETFTIGELIQKTYEHDKAQSKAFKRAIMQIAKEEGEVEGLTDYEDVKLSEKTPEQISFIIKFFLTYILGEELPKEKKRECLFSLKLEIFQNELIKKSDKSETKSLIRKAQNPFEVMKYAVEIIDYEMSKLDHDDESK